jgi:hypothetical protein
MNETERPKEPQQDQFLSAASHEQERGLIAEFVGFMAENKAWWMTPILVVLGLVGVLLVLGATGVMPFIYTLF